MAGRTKPFSSGFTLIEVLVALLIFAVLAAMSYRSMSALLQTKERVESDAKQWQSVMHFFARMDDDLLQHVNRPFTLHGRIYPAWYATPIAQGDDAQLMLTRLGDPNQSNALMDTRLIGYQLSNGNIEWLVWPSPDNPSETKPSRYVVLSGVKQISMRFMEAQSHQWADHWPLVQSKGETIAISKPNAMEITVVLNTGERLTRLYDLP